MLDPRRSQHPTRCQAPGASAEPDRFTGGTAPHRRPQCCHPLDDEALLVGGQGGEEVRHERVEHGTGRISLRNPADHVMPIMTGSRRTLSAVMVCSAAVRSSSASMMTNQPSVLCQFAHAAGRGSHHLSRCRPGRRPFCSDIEKVGDDNSRAGGEVLTAVAGTGHRSATTAIVVIHGGGPSTPSMVFSHGLTMVPERVQGGDAVRRPSLGCCWAGASGPGAGVGGVVGR